MAVSLNKPFIKLAIKDLHVYEIGWARNCHVAALSTADKSMAVKKSAVLSGA